MKRIKSKNLELMSVDQRTQAAAESGILGEKRFALSANPEIRERLDILRNVYSYIKQKYGNEIAGATIGGSHVKGYATQKSDFDGMLFIDREQAFINLDLNHLTKKDALTEKNLNELQKLVDDWTKQNSTIRSQIAAKTSKKEYYLKLLAIETKFHNILSHTFQSFGARPQEYENFTVKILDKDDIIQSLRSKDSEKWIRPEILGLFGLSLDRKINDFRKVVIDELLKQPDGKTKWQFIMKALGKEEGLTLREGWDWSVHPPTVVPHTEYIGPTATPLRHEKIYPSLEKAAEYFLRGTKENQRATSETESFKPQQFLFFREKTAKKINNEICEPYYNGNLTIEEVQKQLSLSEEETPVVNFMLDSFTHPKTPDKARRKDGSHIAVHSLQLFLTARDFYKIKNPKILTTLLLHDIVEDTTVTLSDIAAKLGPEAASFAAIMTELQTKEETPESRRKDTVKFAEQIRGGGINFAVAEIIDRLDDISDLAYLTEKLTKGPADTSVQSRVRDKLIAKFGKCAYMVRRVADIIEPFKWHIAKDFEQFLNYQLAELKFRYGIEITREDIENVVRKHAILEKTK